MTASMGTATSIVTGSVRRGVQDCGCGCARAIGCDGAGVIGCDGAGVTGDDSAAPLGDQHAGPVLQNPARQQCACHH